MKPYVVIGIPSTDQWHADTANSVVAAAFALNAAGAKVHVNNVRNSRVSELRNQIVQNALARNATHIMWVDSDMHFPMDGPKRLLQWNRAIVGCTYRKRRPDFEFIHKELSGPENDNARMLSPLRVVDALPGGFILVNTRVYADLLGAKPYDEVDGAGEDFSFCKKAKDAGYSVILDTELSKQISHIGQMRVPHDIPAGVREWLNKTQG